MVVRVLTLRTAGTNCDHEGSAAFRAAGAQVDHRHVQEIYASPKELAKYRVVFFPGGFSYGDDVAAGKIQAVETKLFLFDALSEFVDRGGFLLGVCNGFQMLVKTGLLPGWQRGRQEFALTNNDSARFEDRWVRLRVEKSRCAFLDPGWAFDAPVAHGEGKFLAKDEETLARLKRENLVVFRYLDRQGEPAKSFPENPNGSVDAIAGITDATGRILGLMPHPERHSLPHHHPQWTRDRIADAGAGLRLFENLVRAAAGESVASR